MEQQTRLIKLTRWKLTIDIISEIMTILMLEKTQILNEQQVFKQWDDMFAVLDSDERIMKIDPKVLDEITSLLEESETAWYFDKSDALRSILDDPTNAVEKLEAIKAKRPFIL